MEELICLLKGHRGQIKERKEERLIFMGETFPQYRTVVDIICERCGKWQNPNTQQFLSV